MQGTRPLHYTTQVRRDRQQLGLLSWLQLAVVVDDTVFIDRSRIASCSDPSRAHQLPMVVFMADMYACMIRRREDRIGGDDDDVRQSDAAAGWLTTCGREAGRLSRAPASATGTCWWWCPFVTSTCTMHISIWPATTATRTQVAWPRPGLLSIHKHIGITITTQVIVTASVQVPLAEKTICSLRPIPNYQYRSGFSWHIIFFCYTFSYIFVQ